MTARWTWLGLIAFAAGCRSNPTPAKPADVAAAAVDSIGLAKDLLFLKAEQQAPSYRHMDRIFPTRVFRKGTTVYPLPTSVDPMPAVTYQVDGKSLTIDSFLVRNHVAALLVIHDGKIVTERYLQGNDETSRWMSFSVGKSVTSTLVGAALADGAIRSLDDPVTRYLPGLAGSAYDGVTVKHLLQMSSGVKYNENYKERTADINTVVECVANRSAGCIQQAARQWTRVGPPGTIYNYNTAETHLLGLVVQAATKKTLSDYLSEKIWAPFGMEADGYWILEGENGPEFAGGGNNMTLRDWGRFGLFILNGGVAAGKPVLPKNWVRDATTPMSPQVQYGKLYPNFPLGYGYLWWLYPPAGPGAVPNVDRAFEAEGVFGQNIHLDPKSKLVVVTWSTWPEAAGDAENRDAIAFMSGLTAAFPPGR